MCVDRFRSILDRPQSPSTNFGPEWLDFDRLSADSGECWHDFGQISATPCRPTRKSGTEVPRTNAHERALRSRILSGPVSGSDLGIRAEFGGYFRPPHSAGPPPQTSARTHPQNVLAIAEQGFDDSKRAGQLCGSGEYFAKNPCVSVGYCRGGGFMLVCQLCLGHESSTHANVDGDHIWVPGRAAQHTVCRGFDRHVRPKQPQS